MARLIEPLAGDQVRITRGRHSHHATFIRHSATGAKAHVFADGQHAQVPTRNITHVMVRSHADRAAALEEPHRVAEVMVKNLGEHKLARDARETRDAIAGERHHARAMHAIIGLSYHGHEGPARHLIDRLDDLEAAENSGEHHVDALKKIADDGEKQLGELHPKDS
jgi:hypothetical protein